jgi:hypothetical protein
VQRTERSETRVSGCDITDEGIENLQLSSLKCNNNITYEGIKNMSFEYLLCGKNINDEDIRKLKVICLCLYCDSPITNEGVRNLILYQSSYGQILLKCVLTASKYVTEDVLDNCNFIGLQYHETVKNIEIEMI